jgi:hypothetical protein
LRRSCAQLIERSGYDVYGIGIHELLRPDTTEELIAKLIMCLAPVVFDSPFRFP